MRAPALVLFVVASLAACGGDDDSPPPTPDAATDATPADAATDATPADASPPDAATGGDAAADAPVADTWTAFGEEFFATYCVECHDTSPKDFRTLADVRASADTIRCGTSDVALEGCGTWPPARQFPIGTGPKPSDGERQRLVAWLDAGAPE